MSNISKDNIQWISNLRAIATIFVIILHISAPAVVYSSSLMNYSWWIGNIYNSSSRFCVPIFFMISGTLIFPKTYGLVEFFKKRVLRVFIPFAFWSFIYIFYTLLFRHIKGNDLNYLDTIKNIFSFLKDGNQTSFHFWFIYVLLGLYLSFPILSKWARNSEIKDIQYFLLLWLVSLAFTYPYINKVKPNIDLSFFSGYIGYVVLGYYLSVIDSSNIKKTRIISIVLMGFGFCITVISSSIMTNYQNSFSHRFYDYLSPNVILFSAGIFLFFKTLNINNKHFLKLLNLISDYSFGIYLVHILILNILCLFGLWWNSFNPLFSIFFIAVLCLIISWTIIFLIRKLPFAKYYSG
jgi:surface polysaccharide O-acyltransferase-like enzyme